MSHHIKGQGRNQITLFPEALDDFVTEENPVRVVDAFVDELDLHALGFNRVIAKNTGRPGYHPAALLKLYIYGYLNRIQSSRRLEKESHRNVELMWLLERLQPDFKTIADFRKDNGKGITKVCRHFIELCRQMNMFTDAIVAIDGSKFKAVNSKHNNYTPNKVKDHIARMEKHIENYLSQLTVADANDKSDAVQTATAEKIAWMKKRVVELKELGEQVEAHPDKQLSTVDPDARLLKTQGMNRQVCYNVQSSVDTKHHLIVTHEVTNTNDRGKLADMTRLTQQALEQKNITVLADKGYYSGRDIKETQDMGASALVPKSDTSGAKKKGIFNRALFKYDGNRDLYVCPAGNELPHKRDVKEGGMQLKVYVNHIACRDCEIRTRCTQSKREPRKIRRWIHEGEMEAMLTRLKNAPDTTIIRKQTVEHPFGTIKMWMGATHFLTKQLKNVSAEMSLHVLAYNLKRMMSIVGTDSLIKAIRA